MTTDNEGGDIDEKKDSWEQFKPTIDLLQEQL